MLMKKVHPSDPMVDKEYDASEDEAQRAMSDDSRRSRKRRSRRRMMRNRSSWLSPSPFHHGAKTLDDDDDDDDDQDKEEESMNMNMCGSHCHSFSGESEGTGMVVITRPKGGNRNLCMDMEEVKACRDLGFELEHHRMLQQQQEMVPSRLSVSASTLDTNYTTSSGGNSPIANWRISSPGMPCLALLSLPSFLVSIPPSHALIPHLAIAKPFHSFCAQLIAYLYLNSAAIIYFRRPPTRGQSSSQGLGAGSGSGIYITTRHLSLS
jgi:hypothetical protein